MSAGNATQAALEPEEEARAGLYGLIARLFYAAPDEQLIAYLLNAHAIDGDAAQSGERARDLAQTWRGMVTACRTAYPVVLENEHTVLFVGTGKSEVTPYLSHYVLRHANDNPLVDLKARLIEWGVARRENVGEPEDHVAGVCEAMRYFIAVQHRSLEEQKDFFEAFVYPGAIAFCDAVTASAKADFYRLAANFACAFFELEHEAFAMM